MSLHLWFPKYLQFKIMSMYHCGTLWGLALALAGECGTDPGRCTNMQREDPYQRDQKSRSYICCSLFLDGLE